MTADQQMREMEHEQIREDAERLLASNMTSDTTQLAAIVARHCLALLAELAAKP